MTDTWHTTVRLTAADRERADALRDALDTDPTIRALSRADGVSRHAVLRLAVEVGLAELERRHLVDEVTP